MADPTNVPLKDILDGLPPVGTKGTVTIPTGGTVYPVLEEKVHCPWTVNADKTFDGAPNRRRNVKELYELELTLQLARASAVEYGGGYPIPGDVFVYTPANEVSALSFYVLETPEERTNSGAIETAKIKCIQAKGTVTFN